MQNMEVSVGCDRKLLLDSIITAGKLKKKNPSIWQIQSTRITTAHGLNVSTKVIGILLKMYFAGICLFLWKSKYDILQWINSIPVSEIEDNQLVVFVWQSTHFNPSQYHLPTNWYILWTYVRSLNTYLSIFLMSKTVLWGWIINYKSYYKYYIMRIFKYHLHKIASPLNLITSRRRSLNSPIYFPGPDKQVGIS